MTLHESKELEDDGVGGISTTTATPGSFLSLPPSLSLPPPSPSIFRSLAHTHKRTHMEPKLDLEYISNSSIANPLPLTGLSPKH